MTTPYYQLRNDLTAAIAATRLRLADAAAWFGFYSRMRGSRHITDCGEKLEGAMSKIVTAELEIHLLRQQLSDLEARHWAAVRERARIGAI